MKVKQETSSTIPWSMSRTCHANQITFSTKNCTMDGRHSQLWVAIDKTAWSVAAETHLAVGFFSSASGDFMSRKLPAWCQSQREKVLTNATSSGYAGISASEINTFYNAIKLNQIRKVREFLDKYPHALYIKVCSSIIVHFLSHHLHSL